MTARGSVGLVVLGSAAFLLGLWSKSFLFAAYLAMAVVCVLLSFLYAFRWRPKLQERHGGRHYPQVSFRDLYVLLLVAFVVGWVVYNLENLIEIELPGIGKVKREVARVRQQVEARVVVTKPEELVRGKLYQLPSEPYPQSIILVWDGLFLLEGEGNDYLSLGNRQIRILNQELQKALLETAQDEANFFARYSERPPSD